MMRWLIAAMATAGLLGAGRIAEAQVSLAPLGGQLTGHLGVATGPGGAGSTPSAGGSVAIIERSGWGVEFDAGYADEDNGRGGGLDVQSYVLNVVGMWPRGRLRPFGTAGAGVLRARSCAQGCAFTLAWTDWALSGGGGVLYRVNEAWALRGDVRYFAPLLDHPDPARPRTFRVWRVAAGATFLWSVE